MAIHNWYKEHQSNLVSTKPGSNWFFFRIDFSKQNCAQNDDLKLCEVKNHWVLKSGFTRVQTACDGAATLDLGTEAAGNQIDDAVDIDSATDTWLRFDTLDDDGPIALTADGYIYARVLDAAVDDGIVDVMLEVVIPAWDTETDSLAE